MYATQFVELSGRVTPVHVPTRTAAERAAYEARLDAAIRRACPGWRLVKTKAAPVADNGRRENRAAKA